MQLLSHKRKTRLNIYQAIERNVNVRLNFRARGFHLLSISSMLCRTLRAIEYSMLNKRYCQRYGNIPENVKVGMHNP